MKNRQNRTRLPGADALHHGRSRHYVAAGKAWTALLCLLLAVTMVLALPLAAAAGDNLATEQVMVVDKADLLSESELETITNEAEQLANQTGWDVRVLTVDDAGGRDAVKVIEDFMADHFSSEDAVGFLIDMDNREGRIATLGKARYYLTDARQDSIWEGRNNSGGAFNYLVDGHFAEAFSFAIAETGYWYQRGIASDTYLVDTDTGEVTPYKKPKSITWWEALISAGAGLLTALGVGGGVSLKYNMKAGNYKYQPHDHSNVKLRVQQDTFVRRFVTQHRIKRSSSGGSHSSGGGSSIHVGSGGHSFGGSGRKF